MSVDPPRFDLLSEHECRALLAAHTIGRIAWQAADGPQVLPVTYICRGHTYAFRTSPYGVLSELIRPTEVALQVDELDEERRLGWSVLVQGRAEAVAEPAEMVARWTVDGLVPWAPGIRNLFIQVVPRRTTGRILRKLPDTDPVGRRGRT